MSRLKLTDREWREFSVGEIFTITIGKSIDGNKVNRQSGKTAYVTRKEQLNGIDGFIDYPKDFLNGDYPVITIGNETAEPFVQTYPFFTGTKVNILKPKQPLSTRILFFIATSLKKHKSKYSYSFTINSTRLKKQNILLPVGVGGKPDWQFMEDFIKQKEASRTEKLIAYYTNRATELMIQTTSVGNIEWKEFKVASIFNIFTGALIDKKFIDHGNIPRISATDNQNGMAFFTENIVHKNFRTFENFISISFLGSVFYQKGLGSLDMKIHGIQPKNFTLNQHVALFLIPLIKSFTFKYGYGYQLSTSVLEQQKMMLPTTSDGNPDWQFMENFIKQIEADKVQTVLNYYNNMKNKENLGGGGKL